MFSLETREGRARKVRHRQASGRTFLRASTQFSERASRDLGSARNATPLPREPTLATGEREPAARFVSVET